MNPIKLPIRQHTAWAATLGLLVVLLFSGCATTPPIGDPGLLTFLSEGKTTRAEVLVTLGQPSGRFENDKIYTYRLGFNKDSGGYYPVERERTASGWPTWRLAKYSLVLVFDDVGMLNRHSLVKVNQ